MVAEETDIPYSRSSVSDATGLAFRVYSSTTALRMRSLRSESPSSIAFPWLALCMIEC